MQDWKLITAYKSVEFGVEFKVWLGDPVAAVYELFDKVCAATCWLHSCTSEFKPANCESHMNIFQTHPACTQACSTAAGRHAAGCSAMHAS